ncbi:MAG TPA: lysylphosphatidylglycerol synthase transmembrane domain-containing protein [Pirellulales bacterium]|nr:lysylphosphatidylglycerol synthase transmembrane domain-containing protein [Pirellulales bacterium]
MPDPQPSSSGKKRLIALAKLALVAAIAWFLHRTALSAWEDLRERHWSPAALKPAWLLAAALLYAAGQVFPGWFWQETLAELGPKPPWFQALRAYLIGHLGKYVPGKATVILIRAGLLRGSSTSATAATLGVFYETLSTLALGSCLAALILALRFSQHAWLILISFGMACVIGVPTLPPVFRRMVQFTRVGRLNPAVAEQAARLDYRLLGLAWLMLPWSWLLQGLSLWATLQAGGYDSELGVIDQVAVCIATIAIATAAGFLSFIPGGLVVREGVLLELLAPWFGEEGALVSAVLSRLVCLVAELAISGILYPLRPARPSAPSSEDEHAV